ncbi:SAM domain-containing protein SAMSN-1a isoform X2 [Dunckerocampus dactyliophorus]|uniref:SAM domain-containing protein SAMSN-1a isoform X2 n=1 Tax=Dunckerocampus dactyliophorus TaxID=161453 RepID=UPI0024056A40|nr:SAM domain-containing protein SAMSN-1a isoform X2 [Dunckerocampus dactyliophorus]
MNLFCFSLEGSMDSLYEAVQASSDGPPKPVPSRSSSRSCSRSCSPALLLDNDAKWRGSGRSISMDMSVRTGTNTHKKNRRTHVSKSASDNEALDNAVGNTAVWKPAKSPEDLVHISNNHNEEMKRTKHKVDSKGGKTQAHHAATKKRDKNSPSQNNKGASTESKPAAKRTQKSGKKPAGKSGKDGTKKNSTVRSPPRTTSPPVGPHYLNVPYRSDTRLYLGKSSTLPTQENTTPGRCPDMISLPGGATPTHAHHYTHNQRWSNPGGNSPVWATVQHTCRRPLTEYRVCSHDFSQTHAKAEWQGGQERDGILDTNCKPPIPPKVTRSITEVDLAEPNRSTSFGRFEGLRQNPPAAKAEENGTNLLPEECESADPHKSAGIGKKMKAISLTMRRKMGKKHAKSFSEEMGDDTETETGPAAEKNSAMNSNSLESLYSGQSSSSGVTSESNGSGQRDSLRLEEDGSYQGQFCGRARVHTDFVPSPYDTDSLKLKAGDIINIISKPPMGIWTGLLNNKVGNFKFIYVDVLVEKEEKEEEDEAPKIRQQKMCKRPRPKTLLELLERLNLEEYASALLLNGYQTVEDLMHLQEKHLIELNVKDPEHRHKLLAAAHCHYPEGDDVRDVEERVPSSAPQEEDSDCPRDSGCFIPSECSDSKEDTEQLADDVAS